MKTLARKALEEKWSKTPACATHEWTHEHPTYDRCLTCGATKSVASVLPRWLVHNIRNHVDSDVLQMILALNDDGKTYRVVDVHWKKP